jgi:hypothetical protein
MLLLTFVERESTHTRGTDNACISWKNEGRAFVVSNEEELVNRVLPLIFRQKPKFSSFIRKLYRWGFRRRLMKGHLDKKNTKGEFVFSNENFQRDSKQLLANMRSRTAEKDAKRKSSSHARMDRIETQPRQFIETPAAAGLSSSSNLLTPTANLHQQRTYMPAVLSPALPLTATSAQSHLDLALEISGLVARPLFDPLAHPQQGHHGGTLWGSPAARRNIFESTPSFVIPNAAHYFNLDLHQLIQGAMVVNRHEPDDMVRAVNILAASLENPIPPIWRNTLR